MCKLIYYPVPRVHAAETAEQSEEGRECKSVATNTVGVDNYLYSYKSSVCAEKIEANRECKSIAIDVHTRRRRVAASTPALHMRAAETAEQSQGDCILLVELRVMYFDCNSIGNLR